MHGAKAAGAGSSAQKGDFVNEDKSSTGCHRESHILALSGPLLSSGRSRGSGFVPCRESSSLAAGLANHGGRGLFICGGKKKTIQGK